MPNEVAVIRDYDIRDKKLVDATAQSTINSTDAIEMKTTDGNQVFIDKASFIKAVGQAFTASDPKTFTKLLGMNGDSPMGIGASDLASVLGVSALWDFVLGNYTPIEYLESTGTQWVHTGYKLSPTSRREFKVYITGAPVGSLNSMWGANSGSNETLLGYNGGTTYYFMEKNGTLYISQNTIHEFDISTVSGAGYVKMDGSTVITSTGSSNNLNEYLFGGVGFTDNNKPDVYHKERIYYYRIYDSEVLVRDFIPVRVGQIGFMYDKVSGKFFANQGTGNFVLGPDL